MYSPHMHTGKRTKPAADASNEELEGLRDEVEDLREKLMNALARCDHQTELALESQRKSKALADRVLDLQQRGPPNSQTELAQSEAVKRAHAQLENVKAESDRKDQLVASLEEQVQGLKERIGDLNSTLGTPAIEPAPGSPVVDPPVEPQSLPKQQGERRQSTAKTKARTTTRAWPAWKP
jgi:polyhydroxyalkanoate synthesis regulator phasin